MASHSAEGTEDSVRFSWYFWLSSESHTRVLISYRLGYWGQIPVWVGTPNVSTRVALTITSSCKEHVWLVLPKKLHHGPDYLESSEGVGVISHPAFSLPAICSRVIRAARSPLDICRASIGFSRANRSSERAMTPVHPVWWLAPSPAPLSP